MVELLARAYLLNTLTTLYVIKNGTYRDCFSNIHVRCSTLSHPFTEYRRARAVAVAMLLSTFSASVMLCLLPSVKAGRPGWQRSECEMHRRDRNYFAQHSEK